MVRGVTVKLFHVLMLATDLCACTIAPAFAAETPAHSRFLLGVSVNEGFGIFDSGLGD